jgi:uncharacterized membrane protein YpjA
LYISPPVVLLLIAGFHFFFFFRSEVKAHLLPSAWGLLHDLLSYFAKQLPAAAVTISSKILIPMAEAANLSADEQAHERTLSTRHRMTIL